jgi:hypothetical protein
VQNFYQSFVRETDGGWLCTEPAELELPSGRIQVAVGIGGGTRRAPSYFFSRPVRRRISLCALYSRARSSRSLSAER